MSHQTNSLTLDDVYQPISIDEAAKILGWSKKSLQTFISQGQYKLPQEWQWTLGVCYFRVNPGSRNKTMFNAYMVKFWQIARSKGDVSIYQGAIERFENVVNGKQEKDCG